MRSSIQRVASALSIAMAVALAAGTASAQMAGPAGGEWGGDAPRRPSFGIGIGASVQMVDLKLWDRASARGRGLPITYGFGVGLAQRITNRFEISLQVQPFLWSSTENLGEFDAAFMTQPFRYQFLFIPIDTSFRVNVIPTPGPVSLFIGAGVRAMPVFYSTGVGSAPNQLSEIDHGTSFQLGAFPEIAVEVVRRRRVGIEFFARYVFGFYGTPMGSTGLRFDTVSALGGGTVGLLLHLFI